MRQEAKENKSVRKHAVFCFCKDRVKFMDFLVINCTTGAERKSEKIDIIVDSARRCLGVVGVSGEAFSFSQTPEK